MLSSFFELDKTDQRRYFTMHDNYSRIFKWFFDNPSKRRFFSKSERDLQFVGLLTDVPQASITHGCIIFKFVILRGEVRPRDVVAKLHRVHGVM